VTVSEPAGALLAEHEPEALARVTVQSVVEPTEKVTVPVGVPETCELTVVS
jgi:hypothetical protein